MIKYKMVVSLIITTIIVLVIFVSLALWKRYPTTQVMVIKVGALLPSKSGDLVENRQQMINGMELAKDFLTNKYGHNIKIEFFFEDGCFLKESVPAIKKFIQNDVPIIGASFCLFGHLPILQVTEAYKIITFNTAANPDMALNLHYGFSTNIAVKDEARALSEFAYNELRARRAVIIHLDTVFGFDYLKYFTRDFSERGGEVLENFPNPPDGKNFKEIIEKIKKLNPDLVVIAHFGIPLATFIREVRAAGIQVSILGNYETEDKSVLDYAGLASEGVIFSSTQATTKTPAIQDFDRRYIKKFGSEPTTLSMTTYDTVIVSVESYISCHGDRDCIARELHNVNDFQGAGGTITINRDGTTKKPIYFKVIKNRAFMPYVSEKHNED